MGFVCLDHGAQFVENGSAKNVVVVGADKMSSIIDYTDRTTCVLFSDGAAAVLLQKDEGDCGIWTANCIQTALEATCACLPEDPYAQQAETVDAKQHFIFKTDSPSSRQP